MRGGRMIDISSYPILSSNISALKDTSIYNRDDVTEVYMTESDRPAVNFDKVKEEYAKSLGLSEAPKSNDAFMAVREGEYVFVEFKNGYMHKTEQHAIRKKIYDSVLIFSDIVSARISDLRTCTDYILVYNETVNGKNPDVIKEKNTHIQPSASYDSFAKKVSSLAGEEHVFFGVKLFENYCFRKVHTYAQKEFEQYLENI